MRPRHTEQVNITASGLHYGEVAILCNVEENWNK